MLNKLIRQVIDAWNAAPEPMQGLCIVLGLAFGIFTGAVGVGIFIAAVAKAFGVFGVVIAFGAIALGIVAITILTGYLRQKR